MALALHRDHRWTFSQIARMYGCNDHTASEHLRALGAKRHSSPARHTIKGRRLHEIWTSVRRRCRSPSHPTYRHYGGRGVGVSPLWDRFDAFYEWAVQSGYRVGLSLLLNDPDRDFSPENCRWGGAREMRRERSSRYPQNSAATQVRAFGELKTVAEWAEDCRCAVTKGSIFKRLRQGIAPEAAIQEPARTRWDQPLPKSKKRVIPKRVSPRIDWARVVRLRRERGMSSSEIAARLGVSYFTIHAGLVERIGKRARRPTSVAWTRIYGLWESLKARTTNPGHPLYSANGAIGVRLCREWQDFETFFDWAIQTGSKPDLCLARIRHRGPFSPGNCEWLTRSEAFARRPRDSKAKKARE